MKNFSGQDQIINDFCKRVYHDIRVKHCACTETPIFSYNRFVESFIAGVNWYKQLTKNNDYKLVAHKGPFFFDDKTIQLINLKRK